MANVKSKLATAAIVALAIGAGFPTSANAATPAAECVEAGNVWVHVEYDDTVTGACADEFAVAQDAMTSAGIETDAGPFYTTIDGRAADNDEREWWSLWTKSPEGDTYGGWEMAAVGADELTLEGGQVVAWTLQPDWDAEAVNPAVDPLTEGTASETAEPEEPAAGMPQSGV